MDVTLPGLLWDAGVLIVDGGITLPLLGSPAALENVFAAGKVWRLGVISSSASLGNR